MATTDSCAKQVSVVGLMVGSLHPIGDTLAGPNDLCLWILCMALLTLLEAQLAFGHVPLLDKTDFLA